jgi:hypothetical protein
VRLAGYGAGQQRFPGAGRSDQQHAFRNAAAEVGVLLRILEKLDDLRELLLRLVHAGHIGKAHLHFVVGVDLGAAARKRHHAAFRAGHAPEEEAPDADQEEQRDDPAEQIRQPPVHDFAGVLHAPGFELLGELRILDPRRGESLVVFERPAYDLVADGHFSNLARLEQRPEFRIRNRFAGGREEICLGDDEDDEEGEPVPKRRRRTRRQLALSTPVAASRVEPRGRFRCH